MLLHLIPMSVSLRGAFCAFVSLCMRLDIVGDRCSGVDIVGDIV